MNKDTDTQCGCGAKSSAEATGNSAREAVYRIDNMDCPSEEKLIRNRLAKVAGVHGLAFNLQRRTLKVTHKLASLDPIDQALAEVGMNAHRQGPSPQKTVFHIDNMDCRNEEALVRRTLEGIAGLESLEFDLPQRTLTVFHSLASTDMLEACLRSVGMHARRAEDTVRTLYRIENMDCPSEEKLIRSHLQALKGVQDLQFDLQQRTLAVTHAEPVRAEVESILASIGMKASIEEDGPRTPASEAPVAPVDAPPAAAPEAAPNLDARTSKVTFRIENMDCPTEEALIRDRLGKVSGIHAMDFNLMQRVLSVSHTLPTTEPIEKALTSIGMKAERQDARGTTTVLHIAKMDCPTEEGLIRGKLQGMPGVGDLQFNLLQRTLTVKHTPQAIGAAVQAIESLGFETVVRTTDEPLDGQAAEQRTNWVPMAVSGIAAVLAESSSGSTTETIGRW